MSSARPRWFTRSSVFLAISMLMVLGGVNALSWGMYRRAARLIDTEIDKRLLAVGQAASPRIEALLFGGAPDPVTVSGDLDRLRAETGLEQAFVLDAERRSVADARPRMKPGTRYDPLRLDPTAVKKALDGAAASSPRYQVAGLTFKGAYLPLRDARGEVAAVLYVEASAELLFALDDLEGVLVATSAASAVLALGLAVMLALGVRAVRREADTRSRAEHLGIMARMAAQVAHEIKNPLSTIHMSAEFLGEVYDLPDDGREILRDVREEVARVNGLVEDFVALSPDIALAPAPHDIAALVEAVHDAQTRTVDDGLSIELDRPDEAVMAVVDQARIRQVLLNLTINARHATAPGGRVTLRVFERDGAPIIEVVDTGRGMSPAELARARDPFYTTKEGGTGLGLAVTQQIVEKHEGRFEIESAPGAGTTCRLVLRSPGAVS